eukprot:3762097-Heterocapsa_arctica.AAC.1
MVVVPPRPPSPVLRMAAREVAPPISHLRPPPPKPHMRAYVRPEVAPPRPWCERHPTACYPLDCAA